MIWLKAESLLSYCAYGKTAMNLIFFVFIFIYIIGWCIQCSLQNLNCIRIFHLFNKCLFRHTKQKKKTDTNIAFVLWIEFSVRLVFSSFFFLRCFIEIVAIVMILFLWYVMMYFTSIYHYMNHWNNHKSFMVWLLCTILVLRFVDLL